jgi:hypothetical protein
MWVNVVLTTSDQRSQEDYELRSAVAQNQPVCLPKGVDLAYETLPLIRPVPT